MSENMLGSDSVQATFWFGAVALFSLTLVFGLCSKEYSSDMTYSSLEAKPQSFAFTSRKSVVHWLLFTSKLFASCFYIRYFLINSIDVEDLENLTRDEAVLLLRLFCWIICTMQVAFNGIRGRSYERLCCKFWYLAEIAYSVVRLYSSENTPNPLLSELNTSFPLNDLKAQGVEEEYRVLHPGYQILAVQTHKTDTIQFCLAFFLFVASFKWVRTEKWPWEVQDEDQDDDEDESEEQKARSNTSTTSASTFESSNIFLRMTSFWCYPLIWKTYLAGKLDFGDLCGNPDTKLEEIKLGQFRKIWDTSFRKSKESTSLFKVCCRVWAFELLQISVPILAQLMLSTLNDYMYQWTLGYIENKNKNNEDQNTFLYAFGYAIILFSKIIVLQKLQMDICRFELQIRYVFVNAIYEKSLRLTQRAKLKMTEGKLQNLISSDVSQIISAFDYALFATFRIVVRVTVSFLALWHLIGIALLPALGYAFAQMLVLALLANFSKYYSRLYSAASDNRIKLTSEGIKSIAVVKSLGWTDIVYKWIMKAREKEVRLRLKSNLVSCLEEILNFTSSDIINLLAIGFYVFSGNSFSLAVLFASNNWLGSLRNCLEQIPRLYRTVILANVSFQRIRQLLIAEESSYANMEGSDDFPRYSEVTLAWYKKYELQSDFREKKPMKFWSCCSADPGSEKPDSTDSLTTPLLESLEEGNPRTNSCKMTRDEELDELSKRGDILICNRNKPGGALSCLFPTGNDEDEDLVIERRDILKCIGTNDEPVFVAGKLNVVIGKVGSGKSTLLSSAACGDVHVSSGKFNMNNTVGVGYVAQEPWLRTGTVKENILMESDFNADVYKETISACCLETDLLEMKKGDKTQIGEMGTKLSGGQRARIAIARAVYKREKMNMFLFDDSLAALDSRVSNDVFKKVLSSETGLLRNKTRILVTNDSRWIRKADHVVKLKGGGIVYCGAAETYINESNKSIKSTESGGTGSDRESVELLPDAENDEKTSSDEDKTEEDSEAEETPDDDADDENSSGYVSFSIYLRYFNSMGHCTMPIAICLIGILIGSGILSNIWLAHWMGVEKKQTPQQQGNMTEGLQDAEYDVEHFFLIYALINLVYVIADFTVYQVVKFGGFFAGIKLHNQILKSIMNAPMGFFWKTHTGKVINRFSSDLSSVEGGLWNQLIWFLYTVEWSLTCVIPVVLFSPWTMLFIVPAYVLTYCVGLIGRFANRDLERLRKSKASPVYLHFSESLDGSHSIRAFKKENSFILRCKSLVSTQNKVFFYLKSVELFTEGSLVTFGTIAVSISIGIILVEEDQGILKPEIAAVLLMFVSSIQWAMNYFVQSMADLEVQMVSTERVFSYIDEEQEPEPDPTEAFPTDWPKTGKIEFQNVRFKYKEESPIVLGKSGDGFSVCVEHGQKVGFVGRTGSGKSTIFKALLRFRDCSQGTILIDNVDIRRLPPSVLRNNISCVSQDNVIFSTSLRENLDPLSENSDDDIWAALETVGLKNKVDKEKGKLSIQVAGGKKGFFSVGERQLLSLARALLRKSRILLLDEATSSIDPEADQKVQEAVRQLRDVTVLSIAHRISTVMDFDLVSVISNGDMIEIGNPVQLLEDSTSNFFALSNANEES